MFYVLPAFLGHVVATQPAKLFCALKNTKSKVPGRICQPARQESQSQRGRRKREIASGCVDVRESVCMFTKTPNPHSFQIHSHAWMNTHTHSVSPLPLLCSRTLLNLQTNTHRYTLSLPAKEVMDYLHCVVCVRKPKAHCDFTGNAFSAW